MLNLAPIFEASKLSYPIPNRSIGNVMLQLSSETGEMCDWINRPWRQKEEFEGECADVINCVVDALWLHFRNRHKNDTHVSDDEISMMVTRALNEQIMAKTQKWKDAVNANV